MHEIVFRRTAMTHIQDGQCGTCAHFGASESNAEVLVQIRITHQAEPELVKPCGHPDNAKRELKVTPLSTCAGFTPAKVA
jgi:hypothetical protein